MSTPTCRFKRYLLAGSSDGLAIAFDIWKRERVSGIRKALYQGCFSIREELSATAVLLGSLFFSRSITFLAVARYAVSFPP